MQTIVDNEAVREIIRKRCAPKMNTGCWLWTGAASPQGYGSIRLPVSIQPQRKMYPAHRVSYEAFIGAIPKGFHIDHLCRQTFCVNPDHLEPVTQRENSARGIGIAAKHSKSTSCPQGHPFTEDNIYRYRGWRMCKICRKASNDKHNAIAKQRRSERAHV